MLGCIGLFAYAPISFALQAWVLSKYWRWFALPLGAPAAPWWALLAAAIIIGFVTHRPRKSEEYPEPSEHIATDLIVNAWVLFLGWALSFFVTGGVA